MSSICRLALVGIGIITHSTPDRLDICRLPLGAATPTFAKH
jgi:hypothetical protein